jgi:hypothetical protein
MSDDNWGDSTWSAVGDLLALGQRNGFAVTFQPDEEGWTVGYMQGMGGGELVSGYKLGDTARAAYRPFVDLIEAYWVRQEKRLKREELEGADEV